MKQLLSFFAVFCLAFGVSHAVFAQSASETTSTDTVTVTSSSTDSLEGITVVEATAAPSGFGLFWRGIGERVRLVMTVDPVKKAELRIKFAEERQALAEKALESGNPAMQERAQKLFDTASQYIEQAGQVRDRLLQNPDEHAARLIRNLATHEVRSEARLDRIEQRVSDDPKKLERFEAMRVKAEEHADELQDKWEEVKGNLPEEVRMHVESVKARIEAVKEERALFLEKQKALIEAVKNGDEDAKEKLQTLHQEFEKDRAAIQEAWKESQRTGVTTTPKVRPGAGVVPGRKNDPRGVAGEDSDERTTGTMMRKPIIQKRIESKIEDRIENRREDRREDRMEKRVQPQITSSA